MITESLVVIAIAGCVSASAVETPGDEPPPLDRWDRAVCLKSPPPAAEEKGSTASAFVVSNGKTLFLVTAAHAAQQTQQKTRLLYRDIDGKPQWVGLGGLIAQDGSPWVRHKNSDIATARIEVADSNPYFVHLSEIAIPIESISVKPIRRTTEIEIAGFPFGLGAKKRVSPIVVVGHIASTEIMTENKWGAEPLVYCSPDLAQGTSGGPAFLAERDPVPVTVVGMYVAVIFDASGGKLSKLVPSRIIHDAVMARGDGT